PMKVVFSRPHGASRRRGATVVESAIVISVCLLFLFGIYEYGRLLMVKHLLENAAREGARRAVVHGNDLTTQAIQNSVRAFVAGQDANLQNFTIQVFLADANGNNIGTWTDASFAQNVAVQIDCDYKPILPSFLMMEATMHLWTRSMMRSEAN